MKKETYVKPEVKSEILDAEVLFHNFGSPAGGDGQYGDWWGHWHCP
jgi:hypothetical protein